MIASALTETFRQGYSVADLRRDILAGITVGIVALPLSMGLAIASGVAPEYGLYTAIVAGILIALTGGSRVNISGPTAAFVVILLPITTKYGLGGLAVATLMAGVILIIMGLCRLGKLVEYVPYPVTIGFTSGIAVVIATLQIKDFFGLTVTEMPEHFIDRIGALASAMPSLNHWDTLAGAATLGVFLVWRQLKTSIPPHLPALITGAAVAFLVKQFADGAAVATIGSQFTWHADGVSGTGIPPFAPQLILPWNLPGADGQPIGLSFSLVQELMTSAFAIAMLGALESLLCAVVADGMTRTRHNPNGELIGQGLGNLVAPFFGGIPATAAIARTATSIRSGANSPIASLTHGLFVLAAILLLAPWLAHIPMASLAALLLMVAWNMSEAHHFVRITKVAPREDVAVLLTCFGLTVIFDMVVAVTVGMLLAGLLLIKRISAMAQINPHSGAGLATDTALPEGVEVYEINGPLFFGAAQKALSTLQAMDESIRAIVLDMSRVNMLDMTAIVAMENILLDMQKNNTLMVLNGLQPRLLLKLRKAGIRKGEHIAFGRDMSESLQLAQGMVLAEDHTAE
ncbi:C4-dicarboxylic acid transporter DauA [Parendozoicomonas haliclonae]|uniref:C4-dicarboxylic acid transporter DauA n=1 Tax=Parendozoicomonas haliclonae TaxID=1960125 RepID=A0A1X7AIA4_9GAMM|nr:C4-dicarboxylic acid transporter DauA [Parendozoicomonas haliclonae]SMA42788.1 C4-dicarboxylic acid transporter DauA [Parendozoicomonas haliclonae]